MSQPTNTVEDIVEMARQLSLAERMRLVEEVIETLKLDLQETNKKPRRSLLGVLSKYGSAPSIEDIDEVRRDLWRNFPRQDI